MRYHVLDYRYPETRVAHFEIFAEIQATLPFAEAKSNPIMLTSITAHVGDAVCVNTIVYRAKGIGFPKTTADALATYEIAASYCSIVTPATGGISRLEKWSDADDEAKEFYVRAARATESEVSRILAREKTAGAFSPAHSSVPSYVRA